MLRTYRQTELKQVIGQRSSNKYTFMPEELHVECKCGKGNFYVKGFVLWIIINKDRLTYWKYDILNI